MNHEYKVEKSLETIVFCLKLIGLFVAIITLNLIITSISHKTNSNRYHYKTVPGQVFDSATGNVYDIDTKEIVFEVK